MKEDQQFKERFLLMNHAINYGSVKSKLGEGVVFGWYNIQERPDEFFVEATPLSAITDEHAIEVGKMSFADTEGGRKLWTAKIGKEEALRLSKYYNTHFHASLMICDFLREKGYAVPFGGKSVEELIEMGILKLRNICECENKWCWDCVDILDDYKV